MRVATLKKERELLKTLLRLPEFANGGKLN